jgi:hypothetical protein
LQKTSDNLGRTSANLGKDIRTIASGVVGVGDSAEVYEIQLSVNSYQLSK